MRAGEIASLQFCENRYFVTNAACVSVTFRDHPQPSSPVNIQRVGSDPVESYIFSQRSSP